MIRRQREEATATRPAAAMRHTGMAASLVSASREEVEAVEEGLAVLLADAAARAGAD